MGQGASTDRCSDVLDRLTQVYVAFDPAWMWERKARTKPQHKFSEYELLLGHHSSPTAKILQEIVRRVSDIPGTCVLGAERTHEEALQERDYLYALRDKQMHTYYDDYYAEARAKAELEETNFQIRLIEAWLTVYDRLQNDKGDDPYLVPFNYDSHFFFNIHLEAGNRTRNLPQAALNCHIVIAPAVFYFGTTGHAVAVIIDNHAKTVEWIDSNGGDVNYNDVADETFMWSGMFPTAYITRFFKAWQMKQPALRYYRVIEPQAECPKLQKGTGGTCSAWSTMVPMLRLLCNWPSQQALVDKIAAFSEEQRKRLIYNWIALCVQIYRFSIMGTPKPIDVPGLQIDTTLPFEPLLTTTPNYTFEDNKQVSAVLTQLETRVTKTKAKKAKGKSKKRVAAKAKKTPVVERLQAKQLKKRTARH
jgi:hypothetical protein